MKISPEALPDELKGIFDAYREDVKEAVEEAADFTAKEASSKLKSTSPKRKSARGGAYARSWTVKKKGIGRVVCNVKHWQLTHLLEFGHATRNGGRTRAIPHIKPVEEEATRQYVAAVKEAVGKVG